MLNTQFQSEDYPHSVNIMSTQYKANNSMSRIHIHNIKTQMMSIIRSSRDILLVSMALMVSVSSIAQQVWPVQLSGAMIPPRSLDLGVYANDRSQDLLFNAVLNDPVKTSLDVSLNLSIEQNGDIIYQTDPNNVNTPLTLSQYKLEQIDGSVLQSYLNAANLTGPQGFGIGSLEIPEGFNQICLQVYGVQRNVPVSNKFCVQGSFFLNQPPQGIMPEQGDKMEYPATQNQLFNWQPMHLGSSNSPGAVEYLFELVQLPDGTYNANDAFESALQVYRTTTMTPSLIYTQAEPQLIPNKVYAWRVKASSVSAPTSKLFQNDGYSEVYTFLYYDGEEPGIDIETFNNPAPLGCEVYNTDFGPISNTESITLPLVESDKVALGYFTMEIVDAVGGADGFSGTGKVAVPMFNTKVNVEFSGLKVNKEMRVYEVQNAMAIVDNAFKLDNAELSVENVANSVSTTYVSDLSSFFSKAPGISRQVSRLNISAQTGQNLPLAIDKQDEPTVAVIGMQFTPRNAYLNLASWKDQLESDPLRFAATALRATPYGVKNNAHLVLLNSPENSSGEAQILESLSIAYAASDDSKMNCDCEGFADLALEKSIQVSPNIAVQTGNGERISLNTGPEDFENKISRLGKTVDFKIVGLDDFEFESISGTLDLADDQSPDDVHLDSTEYDNYLRPEWKGVILDEVSLKGGKGNKILGNEGAISMKGGKLFIDEDNVAYGVIKDKNVLGLDRGRMGDWPYSIDEAKVEIKDGESEGMQLSGLIKLPVFDDSFPYSGKVDNVGGRSTLNAKVEAGPLNMSMWKATFNNFSTSDINTVVAEIGEESQLIPSANFNGDISISMTDLEFTAAVKESDREKLNDVKEAFGIPNLGLDIKDIIFDDFALNPFSGPTDRYMVGTIDVGEESLKIGGKIVEPGQVKILHENYPDKGEERLGLKITMYNGESSLDMIIWAKKSTNGLNDNSFLFEEIEIDTSELKCNCTSAIVPPTDEEWDRIFERIIDKYGPELDTRSEGSLVSMAKAGKDDFLARLVMKERLREGVSKSGMPMLNDNQIIIPFLNDKKMDVEFISGFYSAKSYIKNYAGFKFSDLKNDKPHQLPLDVTDDLKIMGVKKENIPSHAKLLITEFRSRNTGSVTDEAGALMKLMLVYEIYDGSGGEKRYFYFDSKEVEVGAQSVDFSDLNLELVNSEYVDKDKQIKISPTVKIGGADSTSYAHIDCHEGFKYFNIFGVYEPYFSTNKGEYHKSKIIHRKSGPVYDGVGAKGAEFIFNLHTHKRDHSLRDFIAKVSPSVQDDKGGWNFAATKAEQVIFRPGDLGKYEAYLDFHQNKDYNHQTDPGGFKGLYFKHIVFELDGLKDENSKGVTFPVEDVTFDFESGLNIKYKNTSTEPESYPLPRSRKALLGGWKYSLSKIQFHFNDNNLIAYDASSSGEQDKLDEVFLVGEALVPIFEAAPPKVGGEDKFASGYIGFSGALEFDTNGKNYFPKSLLYFNRLQEAKYFSSVLPTLGMGVSHGSELKLEYNDGNGEFEVQATMSGTAGIFWSNETLEGIHLPDKIKSATNGLSFSYDLLKYKDLKINSGDDATNCKGAGTQGRGFLSGIKSLNMGHWGVNLGSSSDDDKKDKDGNDEDEDDDENKALQGFPISIRDGMAFNCQTDTDGELIYVFKLPVSVNLMGDKPSGKSETAGIKADADLLFDIVPHDKGFDIKQFKLGCILIEGEVGPMSIKGGLNILRDYEPSGKDLKAEDVKYSKWGSGFKGGVDITMLGTNLKAVAQYGRTRFDEVRPKYEVVDGTRQQEKYRYGFFDFEVVLPPGADIPILPPSPTSAPVFFISGGGGGFMINMDLAPDGSLFSDSDTEDSPTDGAVSKEVKAPDNDECDIDDDMLKPGVNLSGMEYRPNQESYGGNIMIILSQLPVATPLQMLAGDVGLRVGLQINDVGTLGLQYVQVDGNLYLTPKTIAERRSDYVAKLAATMKYDHPNKELTGSLEVDASFPMSNDPKKAKLFQKNEKQRRAILANESISQKERFRMVAALNKSETEEMKKGNPTTLVKLDNVKARFGIKFKDDFKWTFKLGSWGDGLGAEPLSGYEYSKVTFPVLGDAAFKFYMQMGMDIDNPPPIAELLPSWNTDVNFEEVDNRKTTGAGVNKDGNLSPTKGIILGALIEASVNKSIGPIDGLVAGKIGFDAAMTDKGNITCGSSATDKIGLNGWYAEGHAYAFLKAKLGLRYNLYFRKGKVNVFDAELAAMLRAMLPNPSYINGFVKGHYSVLNGLLDGKFNYQFEFGQQCADMKVDDPVIGIPIVESTSPDDDEEVSVFATPRLKTNWRLGTTISFPKDGKEGAQKEFENYRVELKELYVTEKGSNQRVSASIVFDDDNYGASLKMNEWLKPNTTYQLHHTAMWYVDRMDNGRYVKLVEAAHKDFVNPERGVTEFKTGAFPDEIYAEMVESQTPGLDQRYWHEGYANPHLRFNEADPNLAKMFPKSEEIDGTTYLYEYVARVSSITTGEKQVLEVPIPKYPSSTPFEKITVSNQTYATYFTLPIVKKETVTTREINFPDLDGIASSLKAGQVYKIELMRRLLNPERPTSGPSNTEDTSSGMITARDDNSENSSFNVNRKELDNAVGKKLDQYTKILYTYHFAKSQYESLDEKLKDSEVRYIRPVLARNDLSHPEEASMEYKFKKWDTQDATKFATYDDYYAFTAKEGMDQFDLDRIKRNAFIDESSYSFDWSDYLYTDNFTGGKLKEFLGGTQKVDKIASAKKDYLKKVLDIVWERENSEGVLWNMDFHIPSEMKTLNTDEKKSGRITDAKYNKSNSDSKTNKAVFGTQEPYGFIFQDLKSRVVINQLRLMYDLSFTEKVIHYETIEKKVKKKRSRWSPIRALSTVTGGLIGSQTYSATELEQLEKAGSIKILDKDYTKYWQGVYDRLWNINTSNTTHIKYKSNVIDSDHDGLTLSFPVYSDWQEMNDKVTSGKNIDFVLKPNHDKQGGSDNLESGKEEGELTDDKEGLHLLYHPAYYSVSKDKSIGEIGLSAQITLSNLNKQAVPVPDYIYVSTIEDDPSLTKMAYYDGAGDVVFTEKGDKKLIKYGNVKLADNGKDVLVTQLFSNKDKNLLEKDDFFKKCFVWLAFKSRADNKYKLYRAELDLNSNSAYFKPVDSDNFTRSFGNFITKNVPYKGIVQSIPGSINLAHYDWGGPLISYSREDGYKNELSSFRYKEGMDVGTRDGRQYLELNKNEETEYTIEIDKTGEYTLNFEYASAERVALRLTIDNQRLSPKAQSIDITLPSTGGERNNYTVKWDLERPSDALGVKVITVKNEPFGFRKDSQSGLLRFESVPVDLYNLNIDISEPKDQMVIKTDENSWYKILVREPQSKSGETQYVSLRDDLKYNELSTTTDKVKALQFRFHKKGDSYIIETENGEFLNFSGGGYLLDKGNSPFEVHTKFVNPKEFLIKESRGNDYLKKSDDKSIGKDDISNAAIFSLEEVKLNLNLYSNYIITGEWDTDSMHTTVYGDKEDGHKLWHLPPRDYSSNSYIWQIAPVDDGYYHLSVYDSTGFKPVAWKIGADQPTTEDDASSVGADDLLWSLIPHEDGSVTIKSRHGYYYGYSSYERPDIRRDAIASGQRGGSPGSDIILKEFGTQRPPSVKLYFTQYTGQAIDTKSYWYERLGIASGKKYQVQLFEDSKSTGMFCMDKSSMRSQYSAVVQNVKANQACVWSVHILDFNDPGKIYLRQNNRRLSINRYGEFEIYDITNADQKAEFGENEISWTIDELGDGFVRLKGEGGEYLDKTSEFDFNLKTNRNPDRIITVKFIEADKVKDLSNADLTGQSLDIDKTYKIKVYNDTKLVNGNFCVHIDAPRKDHILVEEGGVACHWKIVPSQKPGYYFIDNDDMRLAFDQNDYLVAYNYKDPKSVNRFRNRVHTWKVNDLSDGFFEIVGEGGEAIRLISESKLMGKSYESTQVKFRLSEASQTEIEAERKEIAAKEAERVEKTKKAEEAAKAKIEAALKADESEEADFITRLGKEVDLDLDTSKWYHLEMYYDLKVLDGKFSAKPLELRTEDKATIWKVKPSKDKGYYYLDSYSGLRLFTGSSLVDINDDWHSYFYTGVNDDSSYEIKKYENGHVVIRNKKRRDYLAYYVPTFKAVAEKSTVIQKTSFKFVDASDAVKVIEAKEADKKAKEAEEKADAEKAKAEALANEAAFVIENNTNYHIKGRWDKESIDVSLYGGEDGHLLVYKDDSKNDSDAYIWTVKEAEDGYYHLSVGGSQVAYFDREGIAKTVKSFKGNNDDLLWSLEKQDDGSLVIKSKAGYYLGYSRYDREIIRKYLKEGSVSLDSYGSESIQMKRQNPSIKFFFTKVD